MLDLHSAATKYNFFDDGRGLKSVNLDPHQQMVVVCLLLQGEPECNIGGVMECGPHSWTATAH